MRVLWMVCVLLLLAVNTFARSEPWAEIQGLASQENGFYRVTITKVDTASVLSTNLGDYAGPFVIFDVILENISGDTLSVNPFHFDLHSVDKDGFAYDDEMEFAGYMANLDFPVNEIWPGERTRGGLVYLIRPHIIKAVLIFDPYRGSAIQIDLFSLSVIQPLAWGELKTRFR